LSRDKSLHKKIVSSRVIVEPWRGVLHWKSVATGFKLSLSRFETYVFDLNVLIDKHVTWISIFFGCSSNFKNQTLNFDLNFQNIFLNVFFKNILLLILPSLQFQESQSPQFCSEYAEERKGAVILSFYKKEKKSSGK